MWEGHCTVQMQVITITLRVLADLGTQNEAAILPQVSPTWRALSPEAQVFLTPPNPSQLR